MTDHTYRDTTWRAELMGSEGWAVFAGPRMLASNLTEHHARFIVTACNCHAELLGLLREVTWLEDDPDAPECDLASRIKRAIRNAEERAS